MDREELLTELATASQSSGAAEESGGAASGGDVDDSSLADLVLLPGVLSGCVTDPQALLDSCATETTTSPDRLMIYATPCAAEISPLLDAVHRLCVPFGLYIEDVWGQCLTGEGEQHMHFDILDSYVVGRLVVRLGAVGQLELVEATENRRTCDGANDINASWIHPEPKLSNGKVLSIQLRHGDAYFMGRSAAGADRAG